MKIEGMEVNQVKDGFEILIGEIGLEIVGATKIKAVTIKSLTRRIKTYQVEFENYSKTLIETERYKNSPKKNCLRCKGMGYLDQYLHIAHGICYKCGGSGEVEKTK